MVWYHQTKLFLRQGKRYKFDYNSYWDGQGIGETTMDADLLFEDQLSYSLRALNLCRQIIIYGTGGGFGNQQ